MKYFTNENKRNRLLSSRISIIVIMTSTLMITSTMITGAYALPTLSVRGLATGTFTCGDGAVHTNSFFQIDAGHFFIRGKAHPQKLGGKWNVVDREVNNGDGGFISGTFYGGKMGKTSFNLLAIHNHLEGLCYDDYCTLPKVLFQDSVD